MTSAATPSGSVPNAPGVVSFRPVTTPPPATGRRFAALAACGGLLLTVLACGPRPTVAAAAPMASAAAALSSLRNLPVLVMPVQRAGTDPALGWASAPGEAELRRQADSLFAGVLGARGLASRWTFGDAVRRLARRNPTYVTDPDRLGVGGLELSAVGSRVAEPLASELRSLVALTEARHVLLPLSVHFAPIAGAPAGTGHAVVQLALVDARASQLLWLGPVSGDPFDSASSAALTSVAEYLADLILAR